MELTLSPAAHDEPLRPEAHEQDQCEAEQEQAVVLDKAQLLGDGVEQSGAEDGAGDGAHAAEYDGREQQRR